MGGLGSVAFAPLVLDGRWLPGLTVVTDHPALACLGSQYAGWQIDRDDYFAMASGPGRALIRAEDLYDDLDVDERARPRRPVPGDARRAARASSPPTWPSAPASTPADLTLLFAPTASLAGGVQIAARVVETALHKLHELEFDVRRVVSGFGTCPLPPVARRRPARRSGARTTRSSTAARSSSPSTRPTTSSRRSSSACRPRRRTTTASRSARCSRHADWDFYKIDPLLFSPAEVRLVSVESGRVVPRRRRGRSTSLERSFRG